MNTLELKSYGGNADAAREAVLASFTCFLRRSREAAFDGAAVRVVSTADPTFVLNFGRADFSVAANFLETKHISQKLVTRF